MNEPDPQESTEAFYDREIAPALAALGRRCEERGLSFAALVCYDPVAGSVASTVSLAAGSPYLMRVAEALRRCWMPGGAVNLDSLLTAICREARKTGHSSVYLQRLGIPARPVVDPEMTGGPP